MGALVAAFPEVKNDVLAKIRKLLQAKSIPVKLNSLSVFVDIQGEGYHEELLLALHEENIAKAHSETDIIRREP